MARELVFGTVHKYDWCCVGGLLQHPEEGKRVDLSQATAEKTGVKDAYVIIYPCTGYSNPDIIRQIMSIENPDALGLFTDPRFFGFVFQIEHELRQKLPIIYYNIWDDVIYPMYNRSYYESCDTLFAISKQTENINKAVLGKNKWITLNDLK